MGNIELSVDQIKIRKLLEKRTGLGFSVTGTRAHRACHGAAEHPLRKGHEKVGAVANDLPHGNSGLGPSGVAAWARSAAAQGRRTDVVAAKPSETKKRKK
jgi:hypothetical protein